MLTVGLRRDKPTISSVALSRAWYPCTVPAPRRPRPTSNFAQSMWPCRLASTVTSLSRAHQIIGEESRTLASATPDLATLYNYIPRNGPHRLGNGANCSKTTLQVAVLILPHRPPSLQKNKPLLNISRVSMEATATRSDGFDESTTHNSSWKGMPGAPLLRARRQFLSNSVERSFLTPGPLVLNTALVHPGLPRTTSAMSSMLFLIGPHTLKLLTHSPADRNPPQSDQR